MREFIIGSIDTAVSHDGDIQVTLTIYPSKLDGHQDLHQACVSNDPIYIFTSDEMKRLSESKRMMESLKW